MMYPVYGALSLYALWLFYLAVMNLKRARDAGTMTRVAYLLGAPILYIGYALDIIVNWFVMTLLLLELPRWREFTVTARLKRHAQGQGWRKAIALWFAVHLLNPYDPSGKHI
jgi:hypothetical protein